jgi:ketosteroid isomerase-like protein
MSEENVEIVRRHFRAIMRSLEVRMKGKSSAAAGVGSVFTVLTLRDGLIAQSEEYLSRAEAVAAAGRVE